MSEFAIVLRSLRIRALSTVLTTASIALAVALLLVILTVRDTSLRAFSEGGGNMNFIVSRDDSPLTSVLNGLFHASAPPRPIEWTRYNEIRTKYPLEFAVPIQLGDSFRGLPVIATTREFFDRYQPGGGGDGTWRVREGRLFEAPFEIVAGARAARIAGVRVGDRLALAHGYGPDVPRAGEVIRGDAPGFEPHHHDDHDPEDGHVCPPGHVHYNYTFEVVGILEPTGGPHDRALVTDLVGSWIVHAQERRVLEDRFADTTEADLLDEDRLITGIYVRTASRAGGRFSGVTQQVFTDLRRDPTLTVAEPGQQIRTLFEIVTNVDRVLLALAGAVLLTSIASILVALTGAMDQRRRQSAVLRVLGFSRARIFGLSLTESALMGLFGGLVGVALGAGGTQLVAAALETRTGLALDPPMLSRWAIALLALATTLSTIAGLLPGIALYRNQVAESLRPAAA